VRLSITTLIAGHRHWAGEMEHPVVVAADVGRWHPPVDGTSSVMLASDDCSVIVPLRLGSKAITSAPDAVGVMSVGGASGSAVAEVGDGEGRPAGFTATTVMAGQANARLHASRPCKLDRPLTDSAFPPECRIRAKRADLSARGLVIHARTIKQTNFL